MAEKDACPICLSEYTFAGDHRIVSLKCGHLFGDQCLQLWFGRKKTASCPKCYKACRRSDVRQIFAESVSVTDVSREEALLEQIEEERRVRAVLEKENDRLCTMVKYLSNEVARFEEASRSLERKQEMQCRVHTKLSKKVHVKTHDSAVLVYDSVGSVLLYTAKEGGLGIRKMSTDDGNGTEFVPAFDPDEGTIIRDIKVSPYNDGLVCVTCGCVLKVLAMHEEREIAKFCAEEKLWSVCFDPTSRSTLFAGDERGHVNVFCIGEAVVKRVFLGGCPIHSLHKVHKVLYCAGFLGLWAVDCERWVVEKIDVVACFICTNLYGDRDRMVAVLRNRHMRTKHFVHGAKEVLLHTNHTQFRRRRDKVYGQLLFAADDEHNRITVYDTRAMRTRHVYSVHGRILDFYNTCEGFYVLSEGCFYVFSQ